MYTSGLTAIATSSDTAVTLMTIPAGVSSNLMQVTVINEGSVAGFFSVDGGTTWVRLPAGPASVTVNYAINSGGNVLLQRIASGSNVTGVFAFAH